MITFFYSLISYCDDYCSMISSRYHPISILFYVYTYMTYIHTYIYIYTHMFTTIVGLLNSPYPSEFLPPQGGRAAAKVGLGVRGDADGGQGCSPGPWESWLFR